MKRNHNLYNGVILALAASVLLGKVALAEESPAVDQTPTNSTIVLALADAPQTVTAETAHDLNHAVLEALKSVSADNKSDLDSTLSDLTSEFLMAAR